MARPNFVWRLDDLKGKETLRTAADGSELKIEAETYRLWLNNSLVLTEEKQEDGSWEIVETREAKV